VSDNVEKSFETDIHTYIFWGNFYSIRRLGICMQNTDEKTTVGVYMFSKNLNATSKHQAPEMRQGATAVMRTQKH
jgi:hypothetical protein